MPLESSLIVRNLMDLQAGYEGATLPHVGRSWDSVRSPRDVPSLYGEIGKQPRSAHPAWVPTGDGTYQSRRDGR